MTDNYEAKIELFKMLLERNELCRLNWNAYQRYNYWSSWAQKTKDTQLKALFSLRNAVSNSDVHLKLVDEAIDKRKDNINYMNRSPNFIKDKLLEFTTANAAVYEFTKQTHKRRMELQRLFNTKQKKNTINVIEYIRVSGKRYTINDMKMEIMDHDVNKILLGE